MSKIIPNDRRLEPDERAYLLMRGEDSRVQMQDQRYPAPVEDDDEDDLEDEEVVPYENWTVSELQAEIRTRNDAGAEIKPASQLKADLVAALEANDEEADQ